MAISFTQIQQWYSFCNLPKGQCSLQFVFHNETNQPLCQLLIEVNKSNHIPVVKGRRKGDDSHPCDCPKCKSKHHRRKREHDEHEGHQDGCESCKCEKCRPEKENGYKQACKPRLKSVKVQTTFCADTVHYCPPSSKVLVDLQHILLGRCVPSQAPHHVLIVTIELDKPLHIGDCIHFSPGNTYEVVRISDPETY